MLSEQDKFAILNGEYGITREGKKVKYVGKRELEDGDYAFPYFFVILSENNEIIRSTYLSEKLTHALGDGNIHELVGLWKDKPEPFNLERALNGEPVKVRCGLKAYIKYVMPPEYKGKYTLSGYIINPDCTSNVEAYSWTSNGFSYLFGDSHNFDVISMWKELEPVSSTVTVTLPRALKEPQDEMWFVDTLGYRKSICDKGVSTEAFNRRVFFGSEEDAKAWFDAMQNSRK